MPIELQIQVLEGGRGPILGPWLIDGHAGGRVATMRNLSCLTSNQAPTKKGCFHESVADHAESKTEIISLQLSTRKSRLKVNVPVLRTTPNLEPL